MIYVTSDIHGDIKAFHSILEQINLQQEDKLYVLGDVIDRNPFGIDILLELMAMKNVFMLLGNHELLMFETLDISRDKWDREFSRRWWSKNGGDVTREDFLSRDPEIQKKILNFIKNLPLEKTVIAGRKRYRLVHAAPHEIWDRCPMDWIAHYGYSTKEEFCTWHRLAKSEELPKGFTIVYGHTCTGHVEKEKYEMAKFYSDDPDNFPPMDTSRPCEVLFDDHKIAIDCGIAYDDYYGRKTRLACVRLDDLKVFYSE